MYAALWHVLPGPWPVKLLIVLLLAALAAYALLTWVFPWLDGLLSQDPGLTVGLEARPDGSLSAS